MAKQSSNPSDDFQPLFVESLEDRKMLSTVEIIAAGSTGEEIMDLRIAGTRVQSFNVAGDDDNLQSYTYTSSSKITADQVRIEFVNASGRAELKLLWQSRAIDPQRIPTNRLRP